MLSPLSKHEKAVRVYLVVPLLVVISSVNIVLGSVLAGSIGIAVAIALLVSTLRQ